MNDLWDRGVEFPDHKDEGNFWERNVPGFLALKASLEMLLNLGAENIAALNDRLAKLNARLSVG